jgi:hypothetical protein
LPYPLLILAIALTGGAQGSHPGVVRGQVWSETLASPIHFATVEVLSPDGRVHGTYTDSTGAYILGGLPPGRQVVRARHVDHALLEVEVIVPAGDTLSLDFRLRLQPVPLPPILARGRSASARSDTLSASAADLGTAAVRALEATPGMAEMGLAEAWGVPGEPIDPSDVLFVRGASADLKLVLLDGAPVYAPFHLGGLIHPFETGVLRSADLYLGGAPVRYDGGLSYVLDLETRTGRRERIRIAGGGDVMSARALAEGPLGPAGFLVTGRAVHGLGLGELYAGEFPYAYADGLVRVHLPTEEGVLGFTGFWNRESVALPQGDAANHAATWGNRAYSVRYRGPFGETPAELGVAFSEFSATLPIGRQQPRLADGTAQRLRIMTNFHAPGEMPVDISYGASLDIVNFSYQLVPLGDWSDRPTRYVTKSGASVVGAYLETVWEPLQRLRLRGGVRGDVFSLAPRPLLAPRLSATVLVTDRAALTVAAGQYRQYVREPESALTRPHAFVVPDVPGMERHPLVVSRASHFVVGLDQDLGEGLRAGIEGYFKHFENLPGVAPDATGTQRGVADASGVDLWVRRSEGRVTGWLGYSLGWIWSTPEQGAASSFISGRQLASAGVSAPLGADGLFTLRMGYSAGLPYTAVPEQEGRPAIGEGGASSLFAFAIEPPADEEFRTTYPNHPYLRLDAQMARTWRFGRPAMELTPYLKVLNALNRRDALFYHIDRDHAEPRALGALPVLPVVGVEWRF